MISETSYVVPVTFGNEVCATKNEFIGLLNQPCVNREKNFSLELFWGSNFCLLKGWVSNKVIWREIKDLNDLTGILHSPKSSTIVAHYQATPWNLQSRQLVAWYNQIIEQLNQEINMFVSIKSIHLSNGWVHLSWDTMSNSLTKNLAILWGHPLSLPYPHLIRCVWIWTSLLFYSFLFPFTLICFLLLFHLLGHMRA